jgi:hypothetical protein
MEWHRLISILFSAGSKINFSLAGFLTYSACLAPSHFEFGETVAMMAKHALEFTAAGTVADFHDIPF